MAASVWLSPAIVPPADPLPRGSCNFRKLDAGVQAPLCGCQRFCLDNSSGTNVAERRGSEQAWCFCGHHACFHHASPQHGSVSASSLCDLARDQTLETSPLPSTAPPSVSYEQTELKHDGQSSHGTRSWYQVDTPMTFPYSTQYAHVPEDLVGSATEINTPSPRTDLQLPILRPCTIPLQPRPDTALNHVHAASHVSQSDKFTENQARAVQPAPLTQDSKTLTYELQNTIQSYARRLDILENCSFSHVPAEEIQEKFELVEGRLLDLEGWRTDNQAQDDADGDTLDESPCDDSLVETNPETSQRLTDIEERLGWLEGMNPSYSCPWEFEIVLLPWGEKLRGIWVTPPESDASESSTPEQVSGHWSSLPPPAKEPSDPSSNEGSGLPLSWAPTWSMVTGRGGLVPKAPGSNNVVFRRLRSRGLVRTASVTECSAHHIWNVIYGVFRSFLVKDAVHGNRLASVLPDYLGLNQPLVPLRKVKRVSVLNFLDGHEMVTPSLWDFAFLKSVCMYSRGTYRLYVTTPDSYVQPGPGPWSWSWTRLRELSPVHDPKDTIKSEPLDDEAVDLAASEEQCWNHHPVLDHSEDSSLSFSSNNYGWSSRSQSPVEPSSQCLPGAESSPLISTPFTPRAAAKRLRQSVSVSELAERTLPSSSSKRCIASFEDDALYQKRRRTSVNQLTTHPPTPRWSHEPNSPSTPDSEVETGSSRPDSVHTAAYGGPQFAYATPHSNSIAAYYLDAGGDTEPDSDSEDLASESENEWEGMAEDEQDNDEVDDGGSPTEEQDEESYTDLDAGEDRFGSMMISAGEEDADDIYDDVDDGLTIYEAHL